MWGQRELHYTMTLRQKNKIKYYELIFYPEGNLYGVAIGLFKTKKDARAFAVNHKKSLNK